MCLFAVWECKGSWLLSNCKIYFQNLLNSFLNYHPKTAKNYTPFLFWECKDRLLSLADKSIFTFFEKYTCEKCDNAALWGMWGMGNKVNKVKGQEGNGVIW